MNHQEATKILDMAKDGQPIPEDVLTEALFMTGDAGCWRDRGGVCCHLESRLTGRRSGALRGHFRIPAVCSQKT